MESSVPSRSRRRQFWLPSTRSRNSRRSNAIVSATRLHDDIGMNEPGRIPGASMTALVVTLGLSTGCFAEMHGGFGGTVRSTSTDTRPGHFGAATGIGGADEHQAGAVLGGLEISRFGGAEDAGISDPPLLTFGGRYERAFTRHRPGVRWYGRMLLGGNPCAWASDEMQPPEEQSCTTPGIRRGISVYSAGFGVALAHTKSKPNRLIPGTVSVGLGVVYTHTRDAVLGEADFLGIELTVFTGADPISGILEASEDH